MKVYFKNVGQGDSIVLTWEDSQGGKKYGIVDCCLSSSGENPVLNQLIDEDAVHIEFCVLSHPHEDHFSGYNQLLDYFEKNKITVGVFYHTARSLPEYLTSSVRSINAKNEIAQLFRRINRLLESGIIADGGSIDLLTGEIALTSTIRLKFLSPSEKEYSIFNTRKYKSLTGNFSKNVSNANILSTIIAIYNDRWAILLTSDAEVAAFKRVLKKDGSKIKVENKLAQVSHHGSAGNFFLTFWKALNRPDGSPAMISVGQNPYNHPSPDVIRSLRQLHYEIYSTNKVGHLNTLLATGAVRVSNALDSISALVTTSSVYSPTLEGEKVFDIS